jgi:hypothetical protein
MCQDNIEDKSGRNIYVSRQQWCCPDTQISLPDLSSMLSRHIDIPPWFVFVVVLTHRYPSLVCFQCCLGTYISDKSGRDISVSGQHWRQIREGYICVKTTLKTNQGGIYMCQDNIEDKSGRDMYVSRQRWRQIREGYLCQDNIEDKSGRDICVKTTLKTNQGEISDSINIYLMLLSMSEKTDNWSSKIYVLM